MCNCNYVLKNKNKTLAFGKFETLLKNLKISFRFDSEPFYIDIWRLWRYRSLFWLTVIGSSHFFL